MNKAELLGEISGILKQRPNVYPVDSEWGFAAAGVISDGFGSYEEALIAANRNILIAAFGALIEHLDPSNK